VSFEHSSAAQKIKGALLLSQKFEALPTTWCSYTNF